MSPKQLQPSRSRAFAALVALAAVTVGAPAGLVAVADRCLGKPSPLDGVKAPWHWTVDDLHSWGRKLTHGLDSSAALVDLFFRLAVLAGWFCLAVLVYTLIDETVFQLRNGMPSGRGRGFGGVGLLGRKLATALVAVLPLSISTTPALIGATSARPAAAASVELPTHLAMPIAPRSTTAPPSPRPPTPEGWSLIEVQRGDSVWSIAERIADGRDVGSVAREIVDANLGMSMNDGHTFSTPALIEPGWVLSVPTSATTAARDDLEPPIDGGYVVEAGDSYWQIAEDQLGPSASGSEIAAYTNELISINAASLGYADHRLLRPGDVVHLADPPAAAEPVQTLPPPQLQESVQTLPPPQAQPVAGDPVPQDAPVAPIAPAIIESPTTTSPPAAVPGLSSTLPVLDSEPAAVPEDWADDGIPAGSGLAAATVLAGSVIAALGVRRRGRLRGAPIGARVLPPAAQVVRTERLLRSLDEPELLARIDLAVRLAAPRLVEQRSRPLAVEISAVGEIWLHPDAPAMPSGPWGLDIDAGCWRLPPQIPLAELADSGGSANQPCPGLVHIGGSERGRVFVDLEAVGVLSVDAPAELAASIVRHAAVSLAVSPFAEAAHLVTVGLEPECCLGNVVVEVCDSLAQATSAVCAGAGAVAVAAGGSTTFALRTLQLGGEAWEPTLALCVGDHDDQALGALTAMARGGGRGVGVMIDRPVSGCVVLRAVDHDVLVLEPIGVRIRPIGLSVGEVVAVADVLAAVGQPLLDPVEVAISEHDSDWVDFVDRRHEFVVQVLGQVGVQSISGRAVTFERSKAQELVVWLSQHRHRPTRMSARTALWDLSVRDATFANVVSDARRAMAKVTVPPSGQEWLARTMNEELPLHDLVTSDAELLSDRLEAARGLDARAAIDVLRPGVALINGMPFAGTSYLWPDAEGITSSLVLLATSAAATLAAHYLAVDDVDGVFWATGQGLKVLAGHEELIALRMRAHAHRGDLAGVRGEWESYERALHADSWAAAEPSPKLVELRRDLLAPSMVAGA